MHSFLNSRLRILAILLFMLPKISLALSCNTKYANESTYNSHKDTSIRWGFFLSSLSGALTYGAYHDQNKKKGWEKYPFAVYGFSLTLIAVSPLIAPMAWVKCSGPHVLSDEKLKELEDEFILSEYSSLEALVQDALHKYKALWIFEGSVVLINTLMSLHLTKYKGQALLLNLAPLGSALWHYIEFKNRKSSFLKNKNLGLNFWPSINYQNGNYLSQANLTIQF